MNIGLFLLIFLILLLAGCSIAFSMFASSALYLFLNGISLTLVAQRLVAGTNTFVLLAIPFFILASNIMNMGGITERIFNFANKLVGHITGGLGHANIIASVIFAGMSGSAVADCAGLGKIEMKAMTDAGYDEGFSSAVTGASSIIGPIVPPSIPMVLYAVTASASVGQLFAAGVLPGILMAVCLSVMVYIECRKKYPKLKLPRATFREIVHTLGTSVFSLLTPLIILGAIVTGVVTPTEAAVVAIIYSSILAVCYGTMNLKGLYEALVDSIRQTIPIMAILAAAQLFGWVITNEQVPQMVLGFFDSFISSKFMALFVINIFLLIVGCFMEAGAAIIILVPVLLPLMTQFGISPVHFGVIMVLNLMIGLITPPVGMVLYILKGMTSLSFGTIVKRIFPYLLAELVALFIVSYWEAFTMFIPRLLFGA